MDQYELNLDGKVSDEAPADGVAKASLLIPAGGTKLMTEKYLALGKDEWHYLLKEGGKARNFTLTMGTSFADYNVPADVESPTSRHPGYAGTTHVWTFPNVTDVEAAGLAAPDFVDAAKVASRMSFFGSLSLGLFFLVLMIAALHMRIWLHLMHFVLLAAACFSFQLLFAYSVLFNATFFFEGDTGLTLTIMGIVTLGLIMTGTATMDWNSVLGLGRNNHTEPEATMPHTVLPVARQML